MKIFEWAFAGCAQCTCSEEQNEIHAVEAGRNGATLTVMKWLHAIEPRICPTLHPCRAKLLRLPMLSCPFPQAGQRSQPSTEPDHDSWREPSTSTGDRSERSEGAPEPAEQPPANSDEPNVVCPEETANDTAVTSIIGARSIACPFRSACERKDGDFRESAMDFHKDLNNWVTEVSEVFHYRVFFIDSLAQHGV